jgi:hypothetical protein
VRIVRIRALWQYEADHSSARAGRTLTVLLSGDGSNLASSRSGPTLGEKFQKLGELVGLGLRKLLVQVVSALSLPDRLGGRGLLMGHDLIDNSENLERAGQRRRGLSSSTETSPSTTWQLGLA